MQAENIKTLPALKRGKIMKVSRFTTEKDVDFVISGSYICMNDNYQEKINYLR